MPITVKYHYVEGHQRERYNCKLDHWAQLNDEMDALVKVACQVDISKTVQETTFPQRMASRAAIW